MAAAGRVSCSRTHHFFVPKPTFGRIRTVEPGLPCAAPVHAVRGVLAAPTRVCARPHPIRPSLFVCRPGMPRVVSIHGDKTQGQREAALAEFRAGRTPIMVRVCVCVLVCVLVCVCV